MNSTIVVDVQLVDWKCEFFDHSESQNRCSGWNCDLVPVEIQITKLNACMTNININKIIFFIN